MTTLPLFLLLAAAVGFFAGRFWAGVHERLARVGLANQQEQFRRMLLAQAKLLDEIARRINAVPPNDGRRVEEGAR